MLTLFFAGLTHATILFALALSIFFLGYMIKEGF